MPSINNYLKSFQNNLPGMKDFRHASRLYLDDNFKLLPKQKFLFHVVITTDEDLFSTETGFNRSESLQLNMLVKACDLPRYGMNLEEKIQYNKKMYAATRIQYDPVNITFHDDHADTVNAFWKKYYEYHIADSVNMNNDLVVEATKDNTYDRINQKSITKFGMDTPAQRKKPYLKSIEIFVLHKKRFTSMTLVNPVIGSWNHDNVDQTDGTGIMQNVMQVMYETVIYKSGIINANNVPGFASINYDKEPSPLTVFGRGTNSIFGPGGVVDGVGSAIRALQNGNILGAIIGASNTYNNAKRIKKKDVKAELKGLAKKGVQEIGKQASNITNPVGAFSVGAAVALGATIASPKGTSDNKTGINTTVISNPGINTNLYLTADEAYNLVNTNETVRDKIAATIYFRDIGSRKDLTVAQNDVEYEGSTDTTKAVYRAKVLTDIRKLVTEGYIRIERDSQDVNIVVEKASL